MNERAAALLTLSARTVRSVLLPYKRSEPEGTLQVGMEGTRTLSWRCDDLSRLYSKAAGGSGDCVQRCGEVLIADKVVDLSRQGSLIAPILEAIPPIEVTSSLLSGGGLGDGTPVLLEPQQADPQRGHLYGLCTGRFYDLHINLRLRALKATQVEVAVVVADNSVPVLRNHGDSYEGALTYTTAVAVPVLFSGKIYAQYILPTGGNGAMAVLHKVRLCFPQVCSANVFPVVRVSVSEGGKEGYRYDGSAGEEWWCCEGSYVRIEAGYSAS